MTSRESRWSKTLAAMACLSVLLAAGCECNPCRSRGYRPSPSSLGALSDPVWQNQEENAEHSDFVVHQHQFTRDAEWLNMAGEDHVKQVAARLVSGQDAKVVVERSMTSARDDTEFQYPVHPNPELDMRRRDVVVRSLAALGVSDADERVMVAPAFAQGITGNEAEAAYARGLSSDTTGVPGVGGSAGFGGFMFRGGF
jgi:hypothetical protein